MKKCRLLINEETEPWLNMAIDEALLDNFISGGYKCPVLRFYKWTKNSISLGYNQKLDEINLEKCKHHDISIVYRPTGGKAVLHKDELTYSFIDSSYNFGDDLFETYKEINKAIALGLRTLGAEFDVYETHEDYRSSSACFRTTTKADLCHKGKKVCGSAQLRRNKAFLQHGSLLLKNNIDMLDDLLKLKENELNILKQTTTSLDTILSNITWDTVKNAFIYGFENYFKIAFEPYTLNTADIRLSDELKRKFVIGATDL